MHVVKYAIKVRFMKWDACEVFHHESPWSIFDRTEPFILCFHVNYTTCYKQRHAKKVSRNAV